MKLSIVIPIYNQAEVFLETYECLNRQTFQNFEIVLGNDKSTDSISDLISKLKDPRLRFFDFETNVGYSRNLARTIQVAEGDIIVLLGADDIFSENYLERVATAFSDNKVTGISRSYYWFNSSPERAVRYKPGVRKNVIRNESITIDSDPEDIRQLLSSCDQLSLLAFRNFSGIAQLIVHDIFTAHVYLMTDALKKGHVIFLSGLPLAVRIGVSQTRLISEIYDDSPVLQWIRLVNSLCDDRREKLCRFLINEWVAKNHIGLLQIRNYGTFGAFMREVKLLVKHRPANLISARFYLIVILCFMLPRGVLSRLVDFVKDKLLALRFRKLKLD